MSAFVTEIEPAAIAESDVPAAEFGIAESVLEASDGNLSAAVNHSENPTPVNEGDTADILSTPEKPLTEKEIEAAVEAILFAGGEALKIETLARAVGKGFCRETIAHAITRLNEFYQTHHRAFTIAEIAGKFSLLTRAEYAPFIQRLRGDKIMKIEKISPAMLDTLAIIAYKQPLTRADIETVRGVACGQLIRQLLERGLVKAVGKKMEVIGYPTLYGTTEQFLKEFGLSSLAELPMLTELKQMKIIADEKTSSETPTEPIDLFAASGDQPPVDDDETADETEIDDTDEEIDDDDNEFDNDNDDDEDEDFDDEFENDEEEDDDDDK